MRTFLHDQHHPPFNKHGKQQGFLQVIGIAILDVTMDAAQQRGGVVHEQVGKHDHHAVEAIEFLHQAVCGFGYCLA
jgi:hypothetical protein